MFLAEERGQPKERRRAKRIVNPPIQAYYWTGGRSRPLPLLNVSETGAFVQSDTEWCPGTIAHFVLECNDSELQAQPENLALSVWAQIVHITPEGMGLQFIIMDRQEEKKFQKFMDLSLGGALKKKKSAWSGLW